MALQLAPNTFFRQSNKIVATRSLSTDEVEARKGTPGEIIDHPFYRDAFSQSGVEGGQ